MPPYPALLLAIAALLTLAGPMTACRAPEPCECPTPPVEGPQATPVDATPPRHPVLPGAERLRPSSPAAQMGLDLAIALFSGDAEAVHAYFTPGLGAEVSPARLRELVAGVRGAHGPPIEVMDAWATELEEDERLMPAAAVLLRMANERRFRLILVLTPSGAIEGFWLRPH